MLVEVEARGDLKRYLSFLGPTRDGGRRMAAGEWYRWNGEDWVTQRWQEQTTRTPDLTVDADAYKRVIDSRATQRDVDDAMRGLEPTLVIDPTGRERIDYADIPLKNADGTLTKYAKNLIDLHAPQAREGEKFNETLEVQTEKVEMVDGRGRSLMLPARMADQVAKQRGLKVMRKSRKHPGRRYKTTDGRIVHLARTAHGVVEVPAS